MTPQALALPFAALHFIPADRRAIGLAPTTVSVPRRSHLQFRY